MAKIHIEKAELERILKIAGSCVIPNRTFPISEFVRVTTKGDRIKIEAANTVAGIRTYAGMDMETEETSFCVNYKDLLRYVGAIADDSVTIDVKGDENCITIMHSGGELTLPSVDAKDFPEIAAPGCEGCHEFKISGETMSAWLQTVKNFVVEDNLRPVFNGAHLEGVDGHLTLSASDTKVLYNDSVCLDATDEPFAANIPSAAFGAVVSICEKAEEVSVTVGEQKVWVKSGSTVLSIVLLVGKYPNVKSIIPHQHLFEATVSKKRLLESLKRLGIAVGVQSHMIELNFSPSGALTLKHQNIGEMKTASESITYDGSIDYSMCFGYESFMKALSAIDSENVVMRMNDPMHMAVLKEVGGSEDKTILVMPMGKRKA